PITKLQRYQVTFEFLQYLGIREAQELPDYDTLNSNKDLQTLLKEQQGEGSEQDDAMQGEKNDPENPDDLTDPAQLDELDEDEEDDEDEDGDVEEEDEE